MDLKSIASVFMAVLKMNVGRLSGFDGDSLSTMSAEAPSSLRHLNHAFDSWYQLDRQGVIVWASSAGLVDIERSEQGLGESLRLIDCVVSENRKPLGRALAGRKQAEVVVRSNRGTSARFRMRLIPQESGWLVCSSSFQKHEQPADSEDKRVLLDLVSNREATMRSVASCLHDDVGAQLIAVRIEAELLQTREVGVARLIQGLSDAVELVSAISRRLHPANVEQLGLEEAVRYHVEVIAQVCECEFTFSGTTIPIDLDIELTLLLYQIVCMCVTRERILKSTWLRLKMFGSRSQISIQIEHDGLPFDEEFHVVSGERLAMQSRLNSLHGKLCFSQTNSRSSFQVMVPREEERAG